jgi:hypothetical protein
MGLFNFFKKGKQEKFQQKFDDIMKEYTSFVEEQKSKVLNCEDTTGEYYNKIFDDLMQSSGFFYPRKSNDTDEIEFLVIPPDVKYAKNDSQTGQIGMYVFLWLRNISSQNNNLHNHFLSLYFDNKQMSIEEHLNYIQSIIKNDSLTQIIRDTKIMQAISIRLRAYFTIIEKLTETLLTFYVEHENDCVRILLQINKEYSPTKQIKNTDTLTIQDIERIFIRDMLSGKELK